VQTDRLGIQSASYFAKAFKKEFGKTPSQYSLDFTADNKREGKIDLSKEDPSYLN
jgi:AraC-like DNA-binding protein